VPEAVSSEEALLLGDVLATGYFCAHLAEIEPEGTYAVIGCGPVGLMAIIGAHELGAGRIYALDAIPARLKLAAKLGALPLNVQQEDTLAILRDATAGRGADAVLEVVGNEAASRMAMNLVRTGGIISTVGVHTAPHFSFSPAEAYDKNLTFKIGRCPARFYAERLLPVITRRKHDLQAVISHRLPLSEGPRGYRIFDEKLEDCTKVILQP
jgi:threonine dehydrogenase-like Zn-dependent dehydrogenase